jgi:hypothetical protein
MLVSIGREKCKVAIPRISEIANQENHHWDSSMENRAPLHHSKSGKNEKMKDFLSELRGNNNQVNYLLLSFDDPATSFRGAQSEKLIHKLLIEQFNSHFGLIP